MSVQAMAWVFDHSRASLGARLVLQSIANHADKRGGNAFPSIETIAEESHLSERQVRRCIAQLEEIGEIAVYPRATTKTARARGKNNLYGMILMPGYEPPDGLAQRSPQDNLSPGEEGDHGTSSTPPQDKSCSDHRTNRAETGAGTTSSEPSIRTTHEPPAAFDEFWAGYPKRNGVTRGAKTIAFKRWNKLSDEDRSAALRSVPNYTAAQTSEFYMDASRFLNERHFDDYQHAAPKPAGFAENIIAKVKAAEAARPPEPPRPKQLPPPPPPSDDGEEW